MCELEKSNGGRFVAPNDYYVSKGNDISETLRQQRKCEVANGLASQFGQQTGHHVKAFAQ
jgi:hypothetical protein